LVRGLIHPPGLECPTGQDAPGDAGEFVGKGYRQHVVTQPLAGRLDPGLEPVALPDLRLDQHNPRRLHEQNPQVTIATSGYLAEDGTVTGRDLFGNEPQPGGKVATLGEYIPGADRSHHRAGDDRPNIGHARQPLATGILARDRFDLVRQTLDPLVEPAPVAGQIFDNAQPPDVAIQHFERAMRLDPLDPYAHAVEDGMAYAHIRAERYEDAVRWAKRSLQSKPNAGNPMRAIAIGEAMSGHFDEARSAVRRYFEINPDARISTHAPLLHVSAEFQAQIAEALRKAGMPE
jgi:tetratricopeptide (TPR) repeat protein